MNIRWKFCYCFCRWQFWNAIHGWTCVIWLWITMCISNSLEMDFSSVGELRDAFSYRIWFLFTFLCRWKGWWINTFFSHSTAAIADYLWLWKLHIQIDSPIEGSNRFVCACAFFSVGHHHCDQNSMKQQTFTGFYSMWQSKHEKHWWFPISFFLVCLFVKATTFFLCSSQHKARQQLINGFFFRAIFGCLC